MGKEIILLKENICNISTKVKVLHQLQQRINIMEYLQRNLANFNVASSSKLKGETLFKDKGQEKLRRLVIIHHQFAYELLKMLSPVIGFTIKYN